MKYIFNKKSKGPIYITESDELKMNANCPDSEKTGSGPGSCGGNKGKIVTTRTEKRTVMIPGDKSGKKYDVDYTFTPETKGQNPIDVLKKADEAKGLIEKINNPRRGNLNADKKTIVLKKIQDSAIEDFADNDGFKPEDTEILERGISAANEAGITGEKEQMDFAEKYSIAYDKAWKKAVRDAKSEGFEA